MPTFLLTGVLVLGCTSDATTAGPGAGGTTEGASSSGGAGTSGGGASGGGEARVIGPDLSTAAPTSTWRCPDGYPIQSNPSFPQPFNAAGATSCTILTFLPPTSQPVVGRGTAVAANIRVGAVTGPMRFVRMRILYQNGTGAKCCSLEQYGETFTPPANATSRIALGLLMTEDSVPPPGDLTTVAANDLIGLEVLSPDTPVPGFWPSNGALVPDIANFRAVGHRPDASW